MNEVTIYERVQNPLEFAREMGKALAQSGMFGCKNEQQGVVLALACAVERKNPIELARTYHIIDGKLSMRADAMLAEFRARGGKHLWLETGDDGGKASGEFSYDGQKYTVCFSISDAERMKVVKPNSAWEKDPGAMLRARVISKAIRMIAPEIVAGCYAPEELGDGSIIDVTPAAPAKPANAKEVMRSRARKKAAESQAQPTTEPAEAATSADLATEAPGMEAVSSSPAAAEDAAPPAAQTSETFAETKPIGVSAESLRLIEEYGPRVYSDEWPEKRGKICKMHGVGRIASLTQDQLDGLLHHLKAKELGLKN